MSDPTEPNWTAIVSDPLWSATIVPLVRALREQAVQKLQDLRTTPGIEAVRFWQGRVVSYDELINEPGRLADEKALKRTNDYGMGRPTDEDEE